MLAQQIRRLATWLSARRALVLAGLFMLTVVAGTEYALQRYLGSMYAAIAGFGLLVGGFVVVGREGDQTSPRRQLAALARLTALLLGVGFGYVTAALVEGAYTGDAPYAVLVPLFAGVPLALLGLSLLVQRSAAAFYGCLAILLIVMLIAGYSGYAIVELLLELPQLLAEHAQRPAAVHVFNAAIGTCVVAMALAIFVGVLRIALAGARRHRPLAETKGLGQP